MAFPKKCDDLIPSGYTFEDYSHCRGCGAEIDWYRTPNGKKMPFDHMDKGSSPAVPHWSTCPEADSFRKGR
jgi:hypothetical protein